MLKLYLIVFGLCIPFVYSQQVSTLTSTIKASGGIAIDKTGTLYVADYGDRINFANGNTVLKVLKDGSYSIFAEGLSGASGNAFDSKGNLFQSNISGNSIVKIDSVGNITPFTSQNISSPVGIAIDKEDNVYVANCGSRSIAKITPAGESSLFVENPLFNCPNGLTIDGNGNLYTCNYNNGRVLKITPQKEVILLATIPSSQCGHLTFANNRLYVVGRCANKIFEVSLSGNVKLLAGTGKSGIDDGPAIEATLNLPNGIAASTDGDTLFVNDIAGVSGDCTSSFLNPVVIRMITGVKQVDSIDETKDTFLPANILLAKNYPNPFNPNTRIEFQLSTAAHVSISIFTSEGKLVSKLINERLSAGKHEVKFKAGNLPSGLLFYSIKLNGNHSYTGKMILLK